MDDLGRLSDLRAEQGNLLWAEADVTNLTHQDVLTIAEEFSLHELAVEDAQHLRQRPKIDIYDNHLFLVMHQLNQEDGQLEASQISCFIGPRYVLIKGGHLASGDRADILIGNGGADLLLVVGDCEEDRPERIDISNNASLVGQLTGANGTDKVRLTNGDGKTLTLGGLPTLNGEYLDLGTADLRVTGTTIAAIAAALASARNGATRWQGPGIGTSSATADTGLSPVQQG